MKISFDMDGTLDNIYIHTLFNNICYLDDIYIISGRPKARLEETINWIKQHFPAFETNNKVFCVGTSEPVSNFNDLNGELKAQKAKELGIELHFEDQENHAESMEKQGINVLLLKKC